MWFLTFIIFIFFLGILILAHEFGHFLLAKKFGVQVLEFSFGFPPRIFSKKYKGTTYSVGAIPFGGFVRLLGEEKEVKEPSSFSQKSPGARALIITSGVFFNIILAILIFWGGFYLSGLPVMLDGETYPPSNLKSKEIVIYEVIDASPAQRSGLKPEDVILKIDDRAFENSSDLQNYIKAAPGQELTLILKRDGLLLEKKVIPQRDLSGEGKIGISFVTVGLVKYSFVASFKNALWATARIFILILGFLASLFRKLLTAPEILQNVSGPIGIFFITKKAMMMGLPYLLLLLARLSATLAVVNVLPIPALDGSRLIFLLAEKIRGKKIPPQLEGAIHAVGFILLIFLLLIISYSDIIRYVIK